MGGVAAEKQVVFVNLFDGTKKLYEESEDPLTINGIHLNEEGNRQVARLITMELTGSLPRIRDAKFDKLRLAVLSKNERWFNRYRATDVNDVWGGRNTLHGNFETLRSEEHTSALQSLMRISYDVFCWKHKPNLIHMSNKTSLM